jgi:hypothetical protein
MIVVCFISVLLFNLPTFIDSFNLSEENGIGSSIGGITAPVIGIISSVLLYLALTRQTESNVEQKLKNESDIILMLLNQLDNEFNNFYHRIKINNVDNKYVGFDAFNEFCIRITREQDHKIFESQIKSFKSFYESGQIILIIDSFNLIRKRIEISEISEEMKNLFTEKLNSFYETRLKKNLEKLNVIFETHVFFKDEWTEKIKIIVENNK